MILRLIRKYKKHFIYYSLAIILLTSILLWGFKYINKTFNEKVFNVSNVYKSVEELSSPKYEGRLAGSEGNKEALNYVESYFKKIGVEPAGDKGTYYQNFKSIVPSFNSEPVFNIIDRNGKVIKDYTIGKDFRENLDGFGGSGEVNGELFDAEKYIESYTPSQIKGKIIVSMMINGDEAMEYAIESGAKAIVTIEHSVDSKRSFDPSLKKFKNIVICSLYEDKYKELTSLIKTGVSAHIKIDTSFKILATPNLLGKIEGKDKNSGYVIISSHIDGFGSEADGRYFPNALSGASGTAMVMELSKVMKAQETTPDKTVIFALWNNEKYGLKGSKYYTENPIYSLSKTEVIDLGALGANGSKSILVDSSGDLGNILNGKISQFAQDNNIETISTALGTDNDHFNFISKSVPAVLIQDNLEKTPLSTILDTYEDNIKNVNNHILKRDAQVVLSYLNREIYSDIFPDYLSKNTILVFWIFIAIFTLGWVMKFLGVHSNIYAIFYNLYYLSLTLLFMLFFIVFISNIPSNFNFIWLNGQVYNNTSFYLLLKKTFLYIENIFKFGPGGEGNNIVILSLAFNSLVKSMMLVLSALVLSIIIGMLIGLSAGYKDRKFGDMGEIGSILALSLPDVLVVVFAVELFYYLENYQMAKFLFMDIDLKNFIVPLICITIIPAVYILRITSTAAKEESKKDYVKFARAKGLSDFQVILNHIFIPTAIKVVDSLSSVLTIIISNLIIVEYLYYYPGIVLKLLTSFSKRDIVTSVVLAMTLGLAYIMINAIFKSISYLINPLKREKIK